MTAGSLRYSTSLEVSSASPFRHGSGEASSLRLARLAADLSNGITQQTPRAVQSSELAPVAEIR
ncbi:MAG: hypothetical protein U9N56_09575 [Actinomycetota bacterium]|nr:hypothetical protein [Actinomycetota bacterium]